MDISGAELTPERHDIRAEDVRFSYDRKPIINGITLNIPERTTTAIVGPSGGGKTTLCHLLARFWDVDGGRVTLGGRDVREYDMDSLMRNFSFVFQNVYLFHDTVANNIRFGQSDVPMERLHGGTFTITNLGMYGIESFSPIINQPEVAILGVCAMQDKPVVVDGQITVRTMMNMCLTADHRVVDGALAAQFLHRVKTLMENPALMLA